MALALCGLSRELEEPGERELGRGTSCSRETEASALVANHLNDLGFRLAIADIDDPTALERAGKHSAGPP